MKKVKKLEIVFLCFMWILLGLFNFCGVHSSETGFEFVDDPGPVSIFINKCDPNSFNSKSEVEKFTNAFGYFRGDWIYNFSFNHSLKGLKNRCKVKTVEIPLNSASTESESQEHLTSVSIEEKEKEIIREYAEFWDHGFFSYDSSFYINPENYCIKKMNGTVLNVEICEPVSTSKWTSNPISKGSNGLKFPPTLQKCCQMDFVLTVKESEDELCDYTENSPWKPWNFRGKGEMKIYPNYNWSLLCDLRIKILPLQLAPKIQRNQNSSFVFKDVRFLEDGRVETRDSGNHKWRKLEENTYCVDGYKNQLTGDKITEEIPAQSFMLLQCAPKISKPTAKNETVKIGKIHPPKTSEPGEKIKKGNCTKINAVASFTSSALLLLAGIFMPLMT